MKAENQETVVNETEQIPFDESEPQPEAPLPGADAKEAKIGGKPSTPQKKKWGLPFIGIICAIIITSVTVLANVQALSGIVSKVMSVFSPILLGAAIAYMLNPILKLYERKVFKKIKSKSLLRTLSLIMTYVTVLLLLAAFLLLLIPQLIDSVTTFAKDFNTHVDSVTNFINTTVNKMMSNSDDQFRELIDSEKLISAATSFLFQSEDLFTGIVETISKYGMELINGIKVFFLALFISIYILISKERLKAQTAKCATALLSPSKSRRMFKYVALCNRTFSGFFVGKIVDSLIIGLISLIVFAIFGIPYFFLIATIICITNVIPVFGPFIGAIPSFFIILIVNPQKALVFLILILLIQQLDGNVIGPKILGDTTGISSLGVIISIIVMGEYFGIIGMLIGVPIFAVGISIVKEFLETRLRAKNKPTDTAEYYAIDSLVDPHEQHVTATAKMINTVKGIFQRIFKKKKKSEAKDESSDAKS